MKTTQLETRVKTVRQALLKAQTEIYTLIQDLEEKEILTIDDVITRVFPTGGEPLRIALQDLEIKTPYALKRVVSQSPEVLMSYDGIGVGTIRKIISIFNLAVRIDARGNLK